MKHRIGLSTCGKMCSLEEFKHIASSGINCVEISLGKDGFDTDYAEIKKNAHEAGLEIWSFHLPFHPSGVNDPSDPEPKVQETTLDIQKRRLENAAFLGSKIAVIHPSREPYPDHERAIRIEAAQKTLAKLADFADSLGVQLAVENLPRTCIGRDSGEILELLKADHRLGVCYDTNHLLSESAESFINACGDKIITVHVSDYDFLNERHWLPGEGKNDWNSIYRLLCEVGYAGPWMYELGYNTPETIIRPRALTAADFKRNAEEIFAGSELTVIGTPAPGLEGWKK